MKRIFRFGRALVTGTLTASTLGGAQVGLASEDSSLPQTVHGLWIMGNGISVQGPTPDKNFEDYKPFYKSGSVSGQPGKAQLRRGLPKFSSIAVTDEVIFGVAHQKVFAFENTPRKSYDKNPATIQVNGADVFVSTVIRNLEDLNFPKKALKVGVANQRVWGLTSDGNLYSKPISQSTPASAEGWTKLGFHLPIQDATFGSNHVVLLTQDGKVFAFGENGYGQLGLPLPETANGTTLVSQPTLVPGLENSKIERIFSKANQNYALSKDKELFGWGDHSSVQLNGLQVPPKQLRGSSRTVLKVTEFTSTLRDLQCDLQDIAMGNDFSLLLCQNTNQRSHELWGIGSTSTGVIPKKGSNHAFEWTQITGFVNPLTAKNSLPPLRKLECGDSHCLALGKGPGEFWIWGSNEEGQLGSTRYLRNSQPFAPDILTGAKIDDAFASGGITIAYSPTRPHNG